MPEQHRGGSVHLGRQPLHRGAIRSSRLWQFDQAEAIDAACLRSPIGKLLPNALYVHRCALDELEPLLRVYEGCARAYLGEIEEANLLKLHRFSGKLSYLMYPDFDTDPHARL